MPPTISVVLQFHLSLLLASAKEFIQDEDIVCWENHGNIYARSLISKPPLKADPSASPNFTGTQFTNWNFFACTTRTSGKVANRTCLERTISGEVEM